MFRRQSLHELSRFLNRRLTRLDAYLILVTASIEAAASLVPWIQLPATTAEGALSLWLLVLGIRSRPRSSKDGASA